MAPVLTCVMPVPLIAPTVCELAEIRTVPSLPMPKLPAVALPAVFANSNVAPASTSTPFVFKIDPVTLNAPALTVV